MFGVMFVVILGMAYTVLGKFNDWFEELGNNRGSQLIKKTLINLLFIITPLSFSMYSTNVQNYINTVVRIIKVFL